MGQTCNEHHDDDGINISELVCNILKNVQLKFKVCNGCTLEKHACEFYKDKTRSSGLASRCKSCKQPAKNKPKPIEIVEGERKVCNKCDTEKGVEDFYKSKYCLKGVRPSCKKCCKEDQKNYKLDNIEKIKESNKKYKGRQDVKEKRKLYLIENEEKLIAQGKKYVEANKESIKQKKKAYCENNRDKINAAIAKRFANNPQAKLAHNMRARFHDALKRADIMKTEKTFDLIGCSIAHCKKHLEDQFTDGMSWDNYGSDRNGTVPRFWHADHVRPIAAFDLTDEDQRKKCFNYKNLQPLWSQDNLKKGCKYTE